MESPEEKFFEELAYQRTEDEKKFEVQLAKAAAGGTALRAKKPAEETAMPGTEGQLTIDVYQTPSDIIVESAIAGVKPEDLDISATPDSVTIRGERHKEKEVRDEDYFYQECYWGRFSRSVILPQEIDPENASVSFKNGILVIRLPKRSQEKTKRLKVRLE